jgi:hypothetical protein
MFLWLASFYAVAGTGMLAAFLRSAKTLNFHVPGSWERIFQCGSGSGAPDPYLWLKDPDPTPDPTPFFNDFKDVKKKFFLHIFSLLPTYPQVHHLQS